MLKKILLLTGVMGLLLLTALTVPSAMAQTGSIHGTVTDSLSGKVLPGTNIYMPETEQGAAANEEGEYTIQNISPGTYQIRASFVGYTTKTKTVTVESGETTVDFQLTPTSATLSELVVVGFGTQEKKNVVSAISSVSSEDIETGTTSTLPQSLQGKVSGVQVTSTSGVLGAPISVRVRGTTSINASSQPLYVVDGVPIVSSQLGFNLGEPGSQAISPLVNLSAEQIESMTILKGAAATAVYGARGANGVVVIQTKEGQAGNNNINIDISGGFTEPTKKYDLMSASEWATMMNYASQHYSILGLPAGIDVFGDLIDMSPDELTDSD